MRSGSGRVFTNKVIREITKAIAASDKGAKAFFYHINGVVAYLIPALIREKRCPEKTSGENYYTLAGMSEEDKLWHQREKYLASVEEEAIRHVNPQNHFRAKLANALGQAKAYEFLLALVNVKMEGDRLKITMNRQVELSEQEFDTVLFQARAVFNNQNANGDGQYVEAVEYVVNYANSNISLPVGLSEEPEFPQRKWGKIVECFIVEHGIELYKHWLEPLRVEEDKSTKVITLNTNSEMVKDRIMAEYWSLLDEASEAYGRWLKIKCNGVIE